MVRKSLSAWRAWIEITVTQKHGWNMLSRSPLGERGLKYWLFGTSKTRRTSLSAWRAWIEIVGWRSRRNRKCIALRLESVDWNPDSVHQSIRMLVALRLESMDWNTAVVGQTAEDGTVALHLESVDWNTKNFGRGTTYILSLSVWRAWIKIATIIIFARLQSAFFRLEDVDWNMFW